MSAALPCPFCGELPVVTKWVVRCNSEACIVFPSATGRTSTEVISNWNNRPTEAHLRERLDQCKAALQWLVDATTEAGEDKNDAGEPFDSVANARQILTREGPAILPGDTAAQCGGE